MHLGCRIAGLVVLGGIVATAVSADWRRIETGSLAWLHAIQFVDEHRGWAAGSNGTLLLTTDGGETWKKVRIPITDTIRDLYFRDSLSGWLLIERDRFEPTPPNRSYFLRTTDGGKTWATIEFANSPERFVRLLASDGRPAAVIGEGGFVATLADLGATESRRGLPEKYLMLAGSVFSPGRFLLVGGGGSIVWTEDDGKSWTPARFAGTAPTSRLNSVHFIDRLNGWAAGNGGAIFSTTDGGRTWNRQLTQIEVDLTDIRFKDKDQGFAVGERGTVLRTSDSGRTWTRASSGLKHRLERLAFSDNRVFAVGFGGVLVAAGLQEERTAARSSN